MNLANITAESLGKQLECEVPEMYIVIAKHDVMGTDDESLCELIGVARADLDEVRADSTYDLVRQQIGALVAESHATRVHGWDGLEAMALEKLSKRVEYENDSEFLLKTAMVANKAQRRGGGKMGILDPSKNNRTSIVLTERLVQKFQGNYRTEERTRELSIHDGSMERVSFDDVNHLLDMKNSSPIPQARRISTMDPTQSELDSELMKRLA